MKAPAALCLPDLPSRADSRPRPDERSVTERACALPRFVAERLRDSALRRRRAPRIGEGKAAAEHFESIPQHSACAELHGGNA